MWMQGRNYFFQKKFKKLRNYKLIIIYYVRDPVQLNLLYEQAKEAILEGTHPVRLEDAIQFAALQVQIQFGDHKEDKHKMGMLAE